MLKSNTFVFLSLTFSAVLQASVIPPAITPSIKEALGILSKEGGSTLDYLKIIFGKKFESCPHIVKAQERVCGRYNGKSKVYESSICSDLDCLGTNQLCISESQKGCPCWETIQVATTPLSSTEQEQVQKPLLSHPSQEITSPIKDIETSSAPKCTEGSSPSFPTSAMETLIQHFCSITKAHLPLTRRNPLFSKEYGASIVPHREQDHAQNIEQGINVAELSVYKLAGSSENGESCEEQTTMWDERVCESVLTELVDDCDAGEGWAQGGSVVDENGCLGYGIKIWNSSG